MKNIQQGCQNFILRVQKGSFLESAFYGKFLVFFFFVCWANLFPSFGRSFQ